MKHCLNRLKYKHLISHRPVSYLATAMSGKSQKISKLMAAFFTKEEITILKKTKPQLSCMVIKYRRTKKRHCFI